MAKNTICLWYDKDAEAAARFYAETFPDSVVGAVHRAPSDYPSGKAGDVLTVEFTVAGIPCIGLNGGPAFKHNEAFSFQIATDDQQETDRYWDAIVGNGGQESECGWCKDRWGVSWQITPRVLTEALAAGKLIKQQETKFAAGMEQLATQFAKGCAPVLAASAANANTTATARRAADLLFEGIMLFGVIMDCAIAFVFCERRTMALFADDASIFDVNHSVGEAQYTRVVCDDQHSARGILGDPGQQRHDRIAVLSVEGSRGLVRENGRWLSHDGPCDGDPLLFAAAELEWKCVHLVRETDHDQGVLGLGDGACRVVAAHVQRQADIVRSRQGRKQMVALKDEPHMVAPELGQLLGPGVYRGAAAHANRSARGRQNASENRQQRGLAAPGRPHQQRQFTALERQAHALESLDLSRSIAEQFHDIDGLDDGVGHHVNTIPGSMRVTCTIAPILVGVLLVAKRSRR
jgi:predicted 3-demethylubiquinone-9 3-methyltransferase (glyoxalase superfamily)